MKKNPKGIVDPRALATYIKSHKELHDKVASYVKGPSVLDIGCGLGCILNILRQKHSDWYLVGVDPNYTDLEIESLKNSVVFYQQGFDHIQLDIKFNTVICTEVLEHVEFSDDTVKQLTEYLLPDGRLIITVPNENYSKHHGRTKWSTEKLRKYFNGIGNETEFEIGKRYKGMVIDK